MSHAEKIDRENTARNRRAAEKARRLHESDHGSEPSHGHTAQSRLRSDLAYGTTFIGILVLAVVGLTVYWLTRQMMQGNWAVVIPVSVVGFLVLVVGALGLYLFAGGPTESPGGGWAGDDKNETRELIPTPADNPPTLPSDPVPDKGAASDTDSEVDSSDEEPAPTPPPKSTTPAEPPSWLTDPTENGEHEFRQVITVGRHATLGECDFDLEDRLHQAARTYITRTFGGAVNRWFKIDLDYLRNNVVIDRHVDTKSISVTPLADPIKMYQVSVLLEEFPHKTIKSMHQAAEVQHRLAYMLGGSGLVLALLVILFGYLKIDTVTSGAYSGRLKLAAAAVTLPVLLLATDFLSRL